MANTIQKESKIIYLQIGQNYENLGVQKQFDVSEWTAEFPDAHIYLLFKRPGEEAAAPVNTTLDEDGILTWTVSNWETGIIGIGFAEIRAIDSSTGLVKKSHVIPCSIEASVTDEDAAPDYPSWVDRMLQFGENVDSIYATLPHELEEGIASIQQEAQEQTEAIEQKGITTRASIPADYTTLSDEVTDLKSTIDGFFIVDSATLDLEQGNVDSSGNKTNSDTRLRTTSRIYVPYGFTVNVPSGFKIFIRYFQSNSGAEAGNSGWLTGSVNIQSHDGRYAWFIIGKTTDLAISPSDITTPIEINTYYQTDTTLTVPGKPADAKTTGDAIADTNSKIEFIPDHLNQKDAFVSLWIEGKRIDGNTGAVVNNASHFAITDLVDLSGIYALEFFGIESLSAIIPVTFYEENGTTKVSNLKRPGNAYVYLTKDQLPPMAKYARFCVYDGNDAFSNYGYILHTFKRISDTEFVENVSASQQKKDVFTVKRSINNLYYNDSGIMGDNANFVCGTALFVAKPETNYSVGIKGQAWDVIVRLCYYKEDKTFISKESHSNTTRFTSPAECKYISICTDNSHITTLDDVYVIESDADGRTVPCIEMVNSFDSVYPKTRLKGKKWTTFGDSITASTFRSTGAYHDFIRAETGIVTFNKAVGGSGYKCLDESNKATYQLALTDIAGWSDSDIITCMSGINDCMFMLPPTGNRTELGTYTDVFVEPQDITSYTSNTLMACFNKFISILEENAPFARIGIISPLPTDYTLSGQRYLFKPEDDTNNLSLFVEECKKACKRKGIAYLDLYHTCHLMPWVSAVNNTYYKCYSSDSPDGLHPNVYGHEWIYPAIREFLKTMM